MLPAHVSLQCLDAPVGEHADPAARALVVEPVHDAARQLLRQEEALLRRAGPVQDEDHVKDPRAVWV